jgi:hypothetical protein
MDVTVDVDGQAGLLEIPGDRLALVCFARTVNDASRRADVKPLPDPANDGI